MANSSFKGTHTQDDSQREVNLARTVATRWFSFIEKLGRVMLFRVFVTVSLVSKHFLSAYSVPDAAQCSPQMAYI